MDTLVVNGYFGYSIHLFGIELIKMCSKCYQLFMWHEFRLLWNQTKHHHTQACQWRTSVPVAFVMLSFVCLGAWSRLRHSMNMQMHLSLLICLMTLSMGKSDSDKICWSLQWALELIKQQESTIAGNTWGVVWADNIQYVYAQRKTGFSKWTT